MKSIELWSREARQLSTLEKVYLKEAIEALLSWEPFKRDYGELDLIRRMLECDVRQAEYAWGSGEMEAGLMGTPEARCLRKRYDMEAAPCAGGRLSAAGRGDQARWSR